MAWFLIDSGIPASVVQTADDAIAVLREGGVRVIVVNTTAAVPEVADVVKTLRGAGDFFRIIVLHDGKHHSEDPEIPADACLHDVSDPDALVDTVRAALTDNLPDEEPHEAAQEAIENA